MPRTIGVSSRWPRPKATICATLGPREVDQRRAVAVHHVEGERLGLARAAVDRCAGDRHRHRLFFIVGVVLGVLEHLDPAQERIVFVERPKRVERAVAHGDLGNLHQLDQLHPGCRLVGCRQGPRRERAESLVLDREIAQDVHPGGIVEIRERLGRKNLTWSLGLVSPCLRVSIAVTPSPLETECSDSGLARVEQLLAPHPPFSFE